MYYANRKAVIGIALFSALVSLLGLPAQSYGQSFPTPTVTAVAGDGQVTLTWSEVQSTDRASSWRYGVKEGRNAYVWKEVPGSNRNTTRYTVTGLTNGTPYRFKVQARDGSETGPSSDAVSATPGQGQDFPTPTLSALAGDEQVTLSWSAASATDRVSSWRYGVKEGRQPYVWNDVPGSERNTTTYIVTDLTNGTTYRFKVRAQAGSKVGPSSDVAFATPGEPNCPTLVIDDIDDVPASPGGSINITSSASGGCTPITFSKKTGSDTPSWISVASDGSITGTVPASTGCESFTVTVTATDAQGATADASFMITVTGEALAVDNIDDVPASPGGSINITSSASGGCTPITFSKKTGSDTPSWISVASDGSITGTVPASTGCESFTVTVTATDAQGATADASFMITVTGEALAVDNIDDVPASPGGSINITSSASGGCTPITFSKKTGSDTPSWISVASDGSITGTVPASTGCESFTVTVTATDAQGATADASFAITVTGEALAVDNIDDVPASPGGSINITSSASGGCTPITFSKKTGSDTPSWISVASDGSITGTVPSSTGCESFTVTVTATDAQGATADASFAITVTGEALAVDNIDDVPASPGGSINITSSASGGCTPITFSKKTGSDTPSWISVASDGSITGTVPSSTGCESFTVTVTATDAQGATADASFMITVTGEALAVDNIDDVPASPGGSINITSSASGGCTPITFSKKTGSDTPSWISVASDGSITGTVPSSAGCESFTVTVTATDAQGATADASFAITVSSEALAIDDLDDVTASPGGSINITSSATGGCTPITFAKKPGSDTPSWISVASDGSITGTVPSSAGCESFTVTLTATDAQGATADASFMITVSSEVLAVEDIDDVTASPGGSINITSSATGGCTPVAFTKKTGSDTPSWISVASDGSITGTVPGTAGCESFTVTLTATDAQGATADASFMITVSGEALAVEDIDDVTASPGGSINVSSSATGGCTPVAFTKKTGSDTPSWISVASDGSITGTVPGTAGCESFTVTVTATDAQGATADASFMITVSGEALAVEDIDDVTASPGGSINVSSSASGGCGTKTFTKKSGPSWVSVSSGGRITGTVPTSARCSSPTVTVKVTDGNGNTDEESFTITVPGATLTCGSISNMTKAAGASIDVTATASGGCGTKTFTKKSGPSWVSVSDGGSITGTVPTSARCNNYTVVVKATDRDGKTCEASFTITVPGATLTCGSISNMTKAAGASIDITATTSGGCGTKTFTKKSGPSWISVSSGGRITGTVPTSARCNSYTVVVKATDRDGMTCETSFTITVPGATLTCGSIPDVTKAAGGSIDITATTTGGCTPITFTKKSGPSWISVSSGGRITGTVPTSARCNSYTVVVKATDRDGMTCETSFTITVPGATLTCGSIPDVTKAAGGSIDITATTTGGCTPITFTKKSGPSWISVSSGGRITGTVPTSARCNSYTVVVKATDRDGMTCEASFTITVPGATLTCGSISNMTKAAGASIDITATTSGGCGTKTFTKKSGPSWISVSSGGRITGTVPTSARCNSYTVVVKATDRDGMTCETSFTITVPGATLTCGSIPDVTKAAGGSIDITATTTGGCTPITFTKKSGPSWISVSSGGRITGTVPTSARCNSYTVVVKATDRDGMTCETSFTITVPGATLTCGSIPDVTKAAGGSIDITATTTGGCTPITFTKKSGPSWISVSSGGRITGTVPTSARCNSYTVVVKATDRDGMTCETSFTITVPGATLTCGSIPDVTKAAGGSIDITATTTGGCTPITFTKKSGPSWISVSSGGRITGTVPTSARCNSYTVVVKATDRDGMTCETSFTITVPGATLAIGSISNMTKSPDGSINVTPTASGGCTPITFTKKSGPSWIRVASNGSITGTVPSSAACGNYTVAVLATGNLGQIDDESFDIKVLGATSLSVNDIVDVTVKAGQTMPSRTASASGGCTPIRYSKKSGPSWVSVNSSTGAISGTAQGPLTSNVVTVTATDKQGATDDESFNVRVISPVSVSAISNVVASKGEAISSIQVSASGGTTPYSYSLSGTSGSGLAISSGGLISGTPSSIGNFTMNVTVTDDDDYSAARSFTMRVAEPLFIAPINDAFGELNAGIDVISVDVSGGVTSYSYSLSDAPSGLSISSSGDISGTPTESGNFYVTVNVTDHDGRTASRLFMITISSGDFNRDGRTDADDAAMFNKKSGLSSSDSGFDPRMDLNRDGVINFADMVILTRHIERDSSSRSGSSESGDSSE